MPFDMNAPAGILIKTTLVDYPGTLACAFFFYGCNLRCPYCYNAALVHGTVPSEAVSLNSLFAHLEKRQGVLKGLVLSGGEALLFPELPLVIRKAKSLGYKIKLDTNGMLPEKLASLLEDRSVSPDFIALDVKTSPEKYFMLAGKPLQEPEKDAFSRNIIKTIEIISELPSKQREFRTVLVPPLVQEEDITRIASLLPKDASWNFARFLNQNCQSSEYEELIPCTEPQMQNLVSLAKKTVPLADLR